MNTSSKNAKLKKEELTLWTSAPLISYYQQAKHPSDHQIITPSAFDSEDKILEIAHGFGYAWEENEFFLKRIANKVKNEKNKTRTHESDGVSHQSNEEIPSNFNEGLEEVQVIYRN